MGKDTNTGTLDRSTGYYVKKVGQKVIPLHRLLVQAKDGEIVDHINGVKTDNRLSNLRIVSKSQNNRNRSVKGYTQVKTGKYQVKTSVMGKSYYIGSYENQHDAEVAYKAAAKLAFDITGIDVQEPTKHNEPETIELNGKKYRLIED